jgi:methylglyoxal reductase
MVKRKLGNSEVIVSEVGMGTWAIGGGEWWGETHDENSIKAINTAIDNGVNLVDTAPVYGFGRSESVVGRAIEGRRSEVILSTKCGLWWEDDRGSPKTELEGKKINLSLRPDTIRIEVENSLRRLRTDYIDILHTHWQAIEPEKTPISETMDCLLKLKKEGKVRAIGVSNITVENLNDYINSGGVDVVQEKYSMLDRKIEKEIVPICIENNISILAYSPLEQGLLTGRYDKNTEIPPKEVRNRIVWFKKKNRVRVVEMLNSWSGLLEKYSCTMPQLVIAWTAAQKGITSVLCGARREEQARQNALAYKVDLRNEDKQRMRTDIESLGKPESAE